MTLAVIRIRGHVNVNYDIEYTMKLLRLNRVNHCVVIPNTSYYRGMLQKAKDYITWGEVGEDIITDLITSHGKIKGERPLTNDYLKKNTKFKSIKDLAKAIHEEKVDYKDVPEVKPLFRLPPPRKGGYEGIKRSFRAGGALGNRDDEINMLLRRMI
jgi:large subunit ribosomal protein L30